MVTLEEAGRRVQQAAWRFGTERVPLAAADGRVLAENVTSDIDLPPFNKSSMDGYACRAMDAFQPLQVLEHIPAGRVPLHPITPGTCSKVMTGAPVPEGADCVLVVEQVETLPDGRVRFTGTEPRSNICPTGEDLRAGDPVLAAGTRLRAQHLPVLATVGRDWVRVALRPRVAVLATGDELVPPGASPGPGQIRNSNSIQLAALAEAAGGTAIDLGIVRDGMEPMRAAWEAALAENDIVVSTGGVSMGDYDLVPDLLRELGFSIHFDRVAIQPGKPILFGTRDSRACFGLSGNPVSSFLQFTLLVAPFLEQLQGATPRPLTARYTLGETFTRKNAERMGWVPVRIDSGGCARRIAFHGSAHIHALAGASGLMSFPAGMDTLAEGEMVEIRLLYG